MLRTIIAPSGAGKSTFIASNFADYRKFGVLLLDGDMIREVASVYHRCYAEFGENWWLTHSKKQMANKESWMRKAWSDVGQHLSRTRVSNVVIFTAEMAARLSSRHSVTVVPSSEEYMRNMESRSRMKDNTHPILDSSEIERHRALYKVGVSAKFLFTDLESALQWHMENAAAVTTAVLKGHLFAFYDVPKALRDGSRGWTE